MSFASLLQEGKKDVDLKVDDLEVYENLTVGGAITADSVTATSFDSGTSAVGGHGMALKFQASGTQAATYHLGSGAGVNNALSGYYMPAAGKIVFSTLKVGAPSTANVNVNVATTSGIVLESIPLPLTAEEFYITGETELDFGAGDVINAVITSGSCLTFTDVSVFVVFD